jgi:hypothetical protein
MNSQQTKPFIVAIHHLFVMYLLCYRLIDNVYFITILSTIVIITSCCWF